MGFGLRSCTISYNALIFFSFFPLLFLLSLSLPLVSPPKYLSCSIIRNKKKFETSFLLLLRLPAVSLPLHFASHYRTNHHPTTYHFLTPFKFTPIDVPAFCSVRVIALSWPSLGSLYTKPLNLDQPCSTVPECRVRTNVTHHNCRPSDSICSSLPN